MKGSHLTIAGWLCVAVLYVVLFWVTVAYLAKWTAA